MLISRGGGFLQLSESVALLQRKQKVLMRVDITYKNEKAFYKKCLKLSSVKTLVLMDSLAV